MENNEENKIHSDAKRLLLVAFMAFLGSFLAFYVLMHQTMLYKMRTRAFPAMHESRIRSFENDMRRDFENIEKSAGHEFNSFRNKISAIQTLKYDDAYVIVINLKPFNNDENNIRFSVNGNVATVSGNVIKNKRNGENSYYFTESFEIPEKINLNEIQKEKVNGKYIITLPIEN